MNKKKEGTSEDKKQPAGEKARKKAKHAAPPPKKPWNAVSFSFGKRNKASDAAHKKAEAHRAEEVEKGLEAIYLGESSDDLGKIEHIKRHRWLKIAAGVLGGLFVLSAAVWAGFYYLDPYATDTSGGLDIVIEAEEQVTLGKQESIKIHWKNQARQPIRDAEIRLSFPAEFTPTELTPAPTDEENRIWNLGLLSPDESGTITVSGVFLGRLGNQAAVQALGTYQPTDGREEEELVTSFAITYTDTVLETAFKLPPKLVAGDKFAFEYIVRNVFDDDVSGMEVRFQFPDNFLPSTSGTQLTPLEHESRTWIMPLDSLASHTTNTIRLSGVFTAGTSGDHEFHGQIGRETGLGDFLAIAETESIVPVLSGDLGIQFVVNGSDTNRTIQPGDNLRLAIGYENLSPEMLGDVELEVTFETLVNGERSTESFVSWENLEDRAAGASSTEAGTHTILYDQEALPALEAISPQQSNTIDISLPTIPARNTARDVIIRINVEGRIETVGEDEVNRIVQAKPIELRYRTDATLSAQARYFLEEGAPIGTGPLPPVAGETTRYRVFWVVDKKIHELENVRVEATLPNIASWADRTLAEAGALAYDESTKTVSWELNKMPHDVERLEAWFEIDVTPAEIDIGRFANILGETRFVATDADVNEELTRSKPQLSTDLQNDESARGKGVVRATDE